MFLLGLVLRSVEEGLVALLADFFVAECHFFRVIFIVIIFQGPT